MHLLQGGVTPEIIALWLGHESPNTTHIYVEADLAMKRQALEVVLPRAKGPPSWTTIRSFGSWNNYNYAEFQNTLAQSAC
jgi:hypothetical protein